MTILVIDDETAILEGTKRRLMRFLPPSDRILCASSSQDALRLFRSHLPDIVIADIRMQDMDGLTLLSLLQKEHHLFASIIISAYGQFDYAQTALRLGVEDYLVKPYTVQDLESALKRACQRLASLRSSQQIQLARTLSSALASGEPYLPSALEGMYGEPPPSSPVLLRFDGPVDPWPAYLHWHVLHKEERWMLLGGTMEEIVRFANSLTHVHAGISLPGNDLKVLQSHAELALRMSELSGMPRIVVFCEPWVGEGRTDIAAAFAMDYVSKHLGMAVSMEEICDALHMNYSYFSRLFKQQTGQAFSQYLLSMQMDWARSRLLDGYRVGDLAERLGYGSVESFSKAFARIYGASPRNYLALSSSHDECTEEI